MLSHDVLKPLVSHLFINAIQYFKGKIEDHCLCLAKDTSNFISICHYITHAGYIHMLNTKQYFIKVLDIINLCFIIHNTFVLSLVVLRIVLLTCIIVHNNVIRLPPTQYSNLLRARVPC